MASVRRLRKTIGARPRPRSTPCCPEPPLPSSFVAGAPLLDLRESVPNDLHRRSVAAVVDQRVGAVADKAIESLQQSIFIFQNLGLNYEIATSLNLLGIVFGQKGEFDQAHQNLNRSLEIFTTYNNNKQILKTLNNLGMILWQKGDLDTALEYYNRGQKLAKDLDDKYGILWSLYNWGILNSAIGNFEKSEERFKEGFFRLG